MVRTGSFHRCGHLEEFTIGADGRRVGGRRQTVGTRRDRDCGALGGGDHAARHHPTEVVRHRLTGDLGGEPRSAGKAAPASSAAPARRPDRRARSPFRGVRRGRSISMMSSTVSARPYAMFADRVLSSWWRSAGMSAASWRKPRPRTTRKICSAPEAQHPSRRVHHRRRSRRRRPPGRAPSGRHHRRRRR